MKNIAALVLILLTAAQSQAQLKKVYQRAKQAATGSATLAQLHYFPEQWDVDLTLGYRYTVIDLKGNVAGTTVLEANQNQQLLKSSLTLGILDNVYAQVNWNYLAAMDVTYTKPAATPSNKSTGPEDPTIAVVTRLMDGDSIKLDAKLAFQPSMGDHQEPDANNDGDAKSGGHSVTLGGRFIALITQSSQLSATVDYKMMGVQNSVDQQTKIVSEDDKHNQMMIELATLTELTSELYFGVLLEIVNADSYKSTNLLSNATTDYGSVSGKTLNLVGKYQFTQDSLVEVQAGYLIDYSQTIGTVDSSATGYSLNANYTVHF
ncbi:MAG: hypothetical protein NDI63_14815 [Pseudobdellovibrio sp.]|nr:hypothetical protein [Pseudobdellovibrio sp.]